MKHITRFLIFMLALIPHTNLQGQSFEFKAALGNSFNPQKKATGYLLTLGFQKKIGKKSSLGLEVGHFFNNSRGILPEDLSDSHFVFRDFTNFEPLGADNNPFGWSENSFPGIRMPSKPNRYFNFNLGAKYLFSILEKGKNKIQVGVGLALSYRDEMELVRIIKAARIQTTVPPFSGVDYLIPIFSYNTYLDFGILSEANYTYRVKDNLHLGVSSQILYYPISPTWIIGSALVLSVRL